MNNRKEREPLKIPEYQMNEWFHPFQDYAKTPEKKLRSSRRNSEKFFPFRVRGLGRFRIDISSYLYNESDLQGDDKPAIVITPTQDLTITLNDTYEYVRHMESELYSIFTWWESGRFARDLPTPYWVELKFPNGTLYVNRFYGQGEIDPAAASDMVWKKEGSEEEVVLFIPKIATSIFENIQMRIVQRET